MSARRLPSKPRPDASEPADVREVVAWFERHANPEVRVGMARFAIPSDRAFGISVGTLQREAKRLGRSHLLAERLWQTGYYEARLMAAFVDEPLLVTRAQMDRWAKDFDNWAVCDTVCMHLFDRTPHAHSKVVEWAARRSEFVKRAAFALLASLALHDKGGDDEPFVRGLELVEAAAGDERNFVKKAVNWALRAIGSRNTTLHALALERARGFLASPDPTTRWNGKDALRQLNKPATLARLQHAKKPSRAKR